MTTIVFLHAHPDDEASSTAGTMCRAADRGDRVVVVYATGGEHGEVPDDLADGQSVAEYRRGEAEASARVTGAARVAWLGFADSGMTGWEQNGHELAFASADLDVAARRLVEILDEEDADVLVGYDWHGTYGHPDHIRVHQVAHRAATLAARAPRMLEVTSSRDAMRTMFEQVKAAGMEAGWDPDGPADDGNPFGEPESAISYRVDVRDLADRKREALGCHRSQKTDIGMFLSMPPDVFREAFGVEWFIEPAAPGELHTVDLPW